MTLDLSLSLQHSHACALLMFEALCDHSIRRNIVEIMTKRRRVAGHKTYLSKLWKLTPKSGVVGKYFVCEPRVLLDSDM